MGRRGARVPAAKAPVAEIEQRDSLGPVSGVAGGRHAIAADQPGIRRWTVIPRGGHFAPAEEPELVARDIRAFFAILS
jgi:pimeloyl-ACP methyl ester carboxylesterase